LLFGGMDGGARLSSVLWSEDELQMLNDGLKQFVTEKQSVTKYIKIAATLQNKSVRDVAFRTRVIEVHILGILSPLLIVALFRALRKRMEMLATPQR
jgi:hypothetical protein